jgi:glycosyltransferase involved in cell wall biosynthesis
MKLSIIIPYYNTLQYTIDLVRELQRQIKDQDIIEIILIDDGCFEAQLRQLVSTNTMLVQKYNGGVSSARNRGIDLSVGEYIAFIDSDDMVPEYYIQKIMEKTKEKWDYCIMSWKAFGISNNEYVIVDYPLKTNTCVWNCVYKKELIGDNRFNPNMQIAEDQDFNERVRHGKKANIVDIMYYYRTGRQDSLSALFANAKIGQMR